MNCSLLPNRSLSLRSSRGPKPQSNDPLGFAMSLEVALTQRVDCAAVVAIAKQACEAILAVYNSEVRGFPSSACLVPHCDARAL